MMHQPAQHLSDPVSPSSAAEAPPTVSSRGARVAAFVAALLALGLAGAIGLRVKETNAARDAIASARATAVASATQRAPLRSAHPVPTQWRPHVEVTGTLKPWREADVGFELGGRLTQVSALEGAKVKAGQTLAVLDASRAAAEVSMAEAQARAAAANLAIADDTMHRTQALAASGSIAEAQLTQAREQVALMRAQLDGANASANAARTGRGQHSIVAPFDGVVTRAPTAAGSVVQPGTPLFHVEDLSHFRLSASIGEDDALLVTVGAPVSVAYRDRAVSGKLITLVPSLDATTRRAPIEIDVPNDAANPLLGNGFVRATIEGAKELETLRVPPNARRPGSQDEVVRVVAGKAQIVHVPHAVDDDGSWLVLRGLAPSDVIALSPADDVHDGDPIDVTGN